MDNHCLTLALALLLAASCGVTKPQVIVRDSIRVEVHDRIIHDSIPYEVPVEIERVITRDTSSHLSNRFSESDAVVSNGFLSHSLITKPQTIYVPVEVSVTDTTTYHEHTSAETHVVEVEVEKPLTWWQTFRIGAFWWLVGLALIGWRRELLWLVKQIIKLF